MECTILEIDQIFGRNRLKIFEKGTKAAITDYAICCGGYVSNDYYVDDIEKLENRTGWYWTKTDDGDNVAHVVNYDGDDNSFYVDLRIGGVRPALSFSLVKSICSNRVRAQDGVLEVECCEYLQQAASKEMQKKLERLFKVKRLSKTGKVYTRDKTKYNDYNQKFQEEKQEEYEYNGKKYARVRVNSYYDGNKFQLSNGEWYKDGDYVWIEASPIKGKVDLENDIMIPDKIILAGVQFNNINNIIDYNKGDFEKTDLYWYLNTYFVNEIMPISICEKEKSEYQVNIEKLQQELVELVDLIPDDLKIKIKNKYNKIIDEYNANCEKEKNSILTNSLSFGIKDSYDSLYASLLFLKEEICLNQNSILKLKQILDYRKILDKIVEAKNDDIGTIEKIIQNIKFELQSIDTETSPYLKDYYDKIISKLEILFSKTEEEYQNQLKEAFGYQALSLYKESDPMDRLKEKLEQLLMTMENPLLQECLEILYSFSEKSDNIDIRSLSDNIKTINYAVSSISNDKKQSNWSYLKTIYQESYSEMISNWIDETIKPETKKEIDTRFRNDLSIYISDIIEVQENDDYLLEKVKEVTNSYKLIFAPSLQVQEKKPTVSSLLMIEIINSGCFNVEFDIIKVISLKVDEITKRLKYAKSRSDIDSIMQEYYKFLTDIWAQVKGLSNFEERKVYIQKM